MSGAPTARYFGTVSMTKRVPLVSVSSTRSPFAYRTKTHVVVPDSIRPYGDPGETARGEAVAAGSATSADGCAMKGNAWDEPDEDGVFELRVTGNFAFEFRHEKDLEKYTIDDGPLESVTIGWAIDGDSPKSIAKIHGLSASLSNVEDHEKFEGL